MMTGANFNVMEHGHQEAMEVRGESVNAFHVAKLLLG